MKRNVTYFGWRGWRCKKVHFRNFRQNFKRDEVPAVTNFLPSSPAAKEDGNKAFKILRRKKKKKQLEKGRDRKDSTSAEEY